MRAILVESTGGPEVLTYREDVAAPTLPAADTTSTPRVLVKVSVAGINYIDTYFREGLYPTPLPFIPGQEGAGTVVEDPSGTFQPGQRVAWQGVMGSYAEYQVVPLTHIVAVPDTIGDEVAASMLLQGLTAHALIHGVYEVSEGTSILLTGGAGGVGLMLTQLAAATGATVYTVTSTDEKEKLSLAAGATQVFRYGDDLAARVRAANGGKGVDVVYDGVGTSTFAQSLDAVRPRGLVALFGAASGPVDPIDPQVLNQKGSIYLTRPSMMAYVHDADERQWRQSEVVNAVADGTLSITVGASYPLAEARQAHTDLQARTTTGSIVLDLS